MRWTGQLRLRLRTLFGRQNVERELDSELRFHLDNQIAENVASGMPPEDARLAALRKVGGLTQIAEECRDARGTAFLESLVQDIRYGLRQLWRAPAFTAIAILTLALGLGANTAMFSVINAVLLRPLPYQDPDRLVQIIDANPSKGFPRFSSSPTNFLDWRAQTQSFAGMAAAQGTTVTLTGRGDAIRLSAVKVTPDLFSVLGVRAIQGRTFTAEEGTYGSDKAVLLSFALWQQRFGGSKDVLNTTIKLNDKTYTVVGVTPPEFRLNKLSNFDVTLPLAFGPQVETQRGAHFITVYARLKPHVSLQQANEEMKVITARLAAAYPDKNTGWTAFALPITDYVVGSVRPAMLILFGAVGFLALIACANVANLLLSRSVSRRHEISVRCALGASRTRLTRQLLTESLLLCVFGAALGVAVAAAAIALLKKFGPTDVPRLGTVELDGMVLGFTAALTLVATILFGLAPAWRAARVDLNAALKSASRSTSGGHDSARPRRLLVFGELALSVILLAGAGLLIRSFVRLSFTNPGIDPANVLTFNVSLPGKKYSTVEQSTLFFDALSAKLGALPGVTKIGEVNLLPASGDQWSSSFVIRGREMPEQNRPSTEIRVVNRDYFQAMRIPLLRGRSFAPTDRPGSPPVLVISDTMARKFWPNGDALGHYVTVDAQPGLSNDNTQGQIIGIVGDVHDFGLDIEPAPTVYAPLYQPGPSDMNIVVRTAGDPTLLAPAVRRSVAELDPVLAVADLAPMETVLATSLAERRFYMMLLSIFAAIALTLAAIGLYGVISYTVNQRSSELGIRMALGARPAQVLGMVLWDALGLAAAGLTAGVLGALMLNQLLKKMLVGISTTDAKAFLGTILTVSVIVVIACYVPARRATSIDPTSALRSE